MVSHFVGCEQLVGTYIEIPIDCDTSMRGSEAANALIACYLNMAT